MPKRNFWRTRRQSCATRFKNISDFDFSDFELFETTPTVENGEILVPGEPGLGLEFDEKAMKRHGVK